MRKYDQFREGFLKALSKSNWQDVVLNATQMLKIDDSEPMVWSNRGVALQQLGFPIDAILNYDKSLAIGEATGGLLSCINYANKGAAYWDMGNADQAIKWLTTAI